jgi:hypothetical protein
VTSTRRSLRLQVPTLEPDDALVARLAAAARESAELTSAQADRRARRRLAHWRVALATAGVVVVSTGGAYAAGLLGPLPRLNPVDRPPLEETEPVPAPSSRGGMEGIPVEPPVGRPSDLPTEGTGRPTDLPTGPTSGPPTGVPSQPPGQPSDLPTGQPSDLPGQPTSVPTPEVTTGPPTGKPSAEPPDPQGQQADRESDARSSP